MRVLIACEESQAVCKEFRKLGHEAFSADIQECSGGHPEWHIHGDALKLISPDCHGFMTQDGTQHKHEKWDMLIAHPPCTYLSNAGTRHFSLRVSPADKVVSRWEERARGAVFFMYFYLANIPKVAVENPVGFMNSACRKPDQIIHPYMFAENQEDSANYVQKKTCLWLRGLPKLEPTNELPVPEPKYFCQGEKCKGKAIGWCEGIKGTTGGQAGRAKERSKTFPGIAKAMAEQWGGKANV